MDSIELIARAICTGCDDNPDHQGDAHGNEYRWQDYRSIAESVLDRLHGTPYEQGRHDKEIELLQDGIDRALRLLSVCSFDAKEDLADLEYIEAIARRESVTK